MLYDVHNRPIMPLVRTTSAANARAEMEQLSKQLNVKMHKA